MYCKFLVMRLVPNFCMHLSAALMNFLTRSKRIVNPHRKAAVGFLFRNPKTEKRANSSAEDNGRGRYPDYLSGAGYLLTKSAAECIHREGMKVVRFGESTYHGMLLTM